MGGSREPLRVYLPVYASLCTLVGATPLVYASLCTWYMPPYCTVYAVYHSLGEREAPRGSREPHLPVSLLGIDLSLSPIPVSLLGIDLSLSQPPVSLLG